VTVFVEDGEVVVWWMAPAGTDVAVSHYSIQYKQESAKTWDSLNEREPIDNDETRYGSKA
jgi:hypothetical protein